LELLACAGGNILDDESLIQALGTTKATAGVITARLEESKATEAATTSAREAYRPAPVRAALLFFVLADLPALNNMYQMSLASFWAMWERCIDEAPGKGGPLPARLTALINHTTAFVHRMVST